jgi:hypothetical protein
VSNQSWVYQVVREREHLSLARDNADGTQTPLTIPNHAKLKSSTLRGICTQAGIARDEFLKTYEQG